MSYPGRGAVKAEDEEGIRGDLDEAGSQETSTRSTVVCSHRCGKQPGGSPVLESMLGKLEQSPAAGSHGGNVSAERKAGHKLPSMGHP